MPLPLCAEPANNVSIDCWHGGTKDSGIGTQSAALWRAQGKEDGLLIGVGFALEPNHLVDDEDFGIEELASDQVMKAPAFGSQAVSEPPIVQALDGV
ncbi:MAG TPA: hypothetical protein VII72_16000 [Myxococcota bacterium]